MMGLGKPMLYTKFEVASFRHCVNIEGNPKFWRTPLDQGQAHPFSACDFMISLGKPQLSAKFEVDSPSRCRNIIEKPDILESYSSPRPPLLFSRGCDFMMGLVKPKPYIKFDVASFSRCRNIKGEDPNFAELP